MAINFYGGVGNDEITEGSNDFSVGAAMEEINKRL